MGNMNFESINEGTVSVLGWRGGKHHQPSTQCPVHWTRWMQLHIEELGTKQQCMAVEQTFFLHTTNFNKMNAVWNRALIRRDYMRLDMFWLVPHEREQELCNFTKEDNTIQRRYLSCVFLRNLNPFTAEMYNTCSTHTTPPPLPPSHTQSLTWVISVCFVV